MARQSKSSAKHNRANGRGTPRGNKHDDPQVHRITGASESVITDSNRKNRIYALLIGVRIASLFVVLLTEGWVQIAVLVGGMLAPWVGVQVANTIRQVDGRAVDTIPPHQAAIEAAVRETQSDDDTTVLVGDFVVSESNLPSDTPSAESAETSNNLDENERNHDDTRS